MGMVLLPGHVAQKQRRDGMGESWCEWAVSRSLRDLAEWRENWRTVTVPLWIDAFTDFLICELHTDEIITIDCYFFSFPFSLRLSLSFFLASQMHLLDSKCREVDFGGLLGSTKRLERLAVGKLEEWCRNIHNDKHTCMIIYIYISTCLWLDRHTKTYPQFSWTCSVRLCRGDWVEELSKLFGVFRTVFESFRLFPPRNQQLGHISCLQFGPLGMMVQAALDLFGDFDIEATEEGVKTSENQTPWRRFLRNHRSETWFLFFLTW